jgi:hypothetical protein
VDLAIQHEEGVGAVASARSPLWSSIMASSAPSAIAASLLMVPIM